ncbi:MAG: M20 family metallo-hydrolase [Spirochaetaceae bacterium]|jgi:succinyl-diaminopimelate desuccinylase|nr:M20 family metallo-hydrolase [Spirochaetaceae bacterium]
MKDKIFSFIDSSGSMVVELEKTLTSIPAMPPDYGGEGEFKKCLFVKKYLCEHGIMDLECIDIPDKRAEGGIRPNLIATIPGLCEQRLWIISHLDVVPPGDMKLWQSNPWEVYEKDGKIYGRGVEDNQQGIVSSIIAALSFIQNNVRPAFTIKLLFVADEECGNGFGIDALLKQHGDSLFFNGDMALIPDGGDPLGETIEIAEKNIAWLKFTTKGKQSHGSRPDEGANAFLAASDLAITLHNRLSQKFNKRNSLFVPDYSTFQPTKKEANIPNINTIPGEDIFYMDMRIIPCYSIKQVFDEVDLIAQDTAARHNVRIEYECLQRTESRPTDTDSPLVSLLSKTIKDILHVTPRMIGIGGGTVAAYLRNAGISAAVWSKIDETAHNPNEYAVISNILDGAKVMAALCL